MKSERISPFLENGDVPLLYNSKSALVSVKTFPLNEIMLFLHK